jgi:hypothetical protein
MRRLIESSLVSLDGITEPPERRAKFDAESMALSWSYSATCGSSPSSPAWADAFSLVSTGNLPARSEAEVRGQQ